MTHRSGRRAAARRRGGFGRSRAAGAPLFEILPFTRLAGQVVSRLAALAVISPGRLFRFSWVGQSAVTARSDQASAACDCDPPDQQVGGRPADRPAGPSGQPVARPTGLTGKRENRADRGPVTARSAGQRHTRLLLLSSSIITMQDREKADAFFLLPRHS